jgi:class 3 adenylate cyclase/streptogramin lyase
MPSTATRRRLATVVFIDIVGSTAIATELGDARWGTVLARFREVVRHELKRCKGREQDTTGDGFLMTFAEPVRALRCAAALTADVQGLGLDIRAGVHTGECEELDGKVGGIAVHIAARIMALAGAAEVYTTNTVRDLVVGSKASFDEVGTFTLKGVEGSWSVCRLRSIEVELPPPLDPDTAAARLATTATGKERRGRRRLLVATAGAAGLLALIAGAILVSTTTGTSGPPSLLRLDPANGRVLASVHDAQPGCGPCGPNLWVDDGTLWERTGADGSTIAVRSLSSGKLIRTIAIRPGAFGVAVGFGSVWVINPGIVTASGASGSVERIDGLSGRVDAAIPVAGDLRNEAIAASSDAIWVLDQNGTLTRIDPASNRISGRFATGALETYWLATGAGYVWICECGNNHDMLRYDPRTRATKRVPLLVPPARWRGSELSNVPRTFVAGVDGKTGTLWFLNPGSATLVPWNPTQADMNAPTVGVSGQPIQATLARGAIWVAAVNVIDRVSTSTGRRDTIPVPKRMNATGIAVDPLTNTVWVAGGTALPRTEPSSHS